MGDIKAELNSFIDEALNLCGGSFSPQFLVYRRLTLPGGRLTIDIEVRKTSDPVSRDVNPGSRSKKDEEEE